MHRFAGSLVHEQLVHCMLVFVHTSHVSWHSHYCTVEPRLTVTSLVRSPHHYGHPGSVPNCIPQCRLAPCNMVTSPLRSLLSSAVVDRISEVPLYYEVSLYAARLLYACEHAELLFYVAHTICLKHDAWRTGPVIVVHVESYCQFFKANI